MIKKWLAYLLALTLILSPSTVFAKGFSGGSSSSRSHTSIHSSVSQGGTYHSGYRSPSSNVTRNTQPASTFSNPVQPQKKSSFLSHAAAFGAGALIGNMLHPFSGNTGGGYGGSSFSFMGFLIDLIILAVVVGLIRKLFFR